MADLIAEANGLTISPEIDRGISAALSAFRKPTGNAGTGDGIDGVGATITVNGVDNASGLINRLTGYQGDAYINVFARQINSVGLLRDGGIVGYDAAAVDGIVTKNGMRRVLVGEAGPEIVNLPGGSSVIPAPMTSALTGKGGRELHIHINAENVYGVDDLQSMIGQAVRATAYQGQY